jgi:hypothetical protein
MSVSVLPRWLALLSSVISRFSGTSVGFVGRGWKRWRVDVNGLAGFKGKRLCCILVTKMCYFFLTFRRTHANTTELREKNRRSTLDKRTAELCFGSLCMSQCPLRAFLCIIWYSLRRHFSSCDKCFR